MSTLRKYRRVAPPQKKSIFTIERTLLAGFVGLSALGLAQPSIMSIAFSDKTPEPTMTAQTQAPVVAALPSADFTPVGSIERKPEAQPKQAETPPVNPYGLRLAR